jgi:hypothetical protein
MAMSDLGQSETSVQMTFVATLRKVARSMRACGMAAWADRVDALATELREAVSDG